MAQNAIVPVIRVAADSALPDNAAYTNRFKIHSSSSDAVYIVAQSKSGRWWSCGCFGWIRHKHCHHLKNLQLPCGPVGTSNYLKPHEVQLVEK